MWIRRTFKVVIDYDEDHEGSGGYGQITPSHIANAVREEYIGSIILVEETAKAKKLR